MYNNNDMVMLINCRTPLQRPPYAAASAYRSLAPPPYNLAVPNVHGRKRAVVCGISYRDSDLLFEGCINDAKCMHYLLTNRFHIPHDSILMLIDTGLVRINVNKKRIHIEFQRRRI